jgi:3-dehydroquinate dehydratase-2
VHRPAIHRGIPDERVALAETTASDRGLALEHVQSNHEGDLVDAVHAARGRCAALIVNGAALTHYGRSLHDALIAFDGIVVELHLSNPHAREEWRHTSVISPLATGIISGFGAVGYRLAVEAVADLLEETDR